MTHEEAIKQLKHAQVTSKKQGDAINYAIEYLKQSLETAKEQPQPLKVEVGGEYQTRDGKEVRIYATDGKGDFPIHGALLTATGWCSDEWGIDGKYSNSELLFDYDLIPKPKKPLEFTEWVELEIPITRDDCGSGKWTDGILDREVKKYTAYLNSFKS